MGNEVTKAAVHEAVPSLSLTAIIVSVYKLGTYLSYSIFLLANHGKGRLSVVLVPRPIDDGSIWCHVKCLASATRESNIG